MTKSLTFYYHSTPNSSKIALILEDLGLAYQVQTVDILRGEQHLDAFVALNPNRKLPVIVDDGIVIFDSTAILLYLARKTGSLLGDPSVQTQAELMSWLMFIASGLGPFTGQAIHFKHYAPVGQDYAANRYNFEAQRHWSIVNERLKGRQYLAGDAYSIADISLWGWCRGWSYLMGEGAWASFPHVERLFREINARPAAQQVEQLASRYHFKQGADAQTHASLFRHGLPPQSAVDAATDV